MRTIRLTHGAGNGVNEACLITASNMAIGRECDNELWDNNPLVCPIIQTYVIETNDMIPENILGKVYGPFIWEILGTNTHDKDIELERLNILRKYAIEEYKIHIADLTKEKSSVYKADDISSRIGMTFHDRISSKGTTLAFMIKEAKKLVKILKELIACGDKRPVEVVLTHDELAEKLDLKEVCVT